MFFAFEKYHYIVICAALQKLEIKYSRILNWEDMLMIVGTAVMKDFE